MTLRDYVDVLRNWWKAIAALTLVGVLADAVGLRTALLIFPVMGVLAFLFAGALRERRRS